MINSLPGFKRAAEAAFQRANPDVRIHVEWLRAVRVQWADGSMGYSGSFAVEADGYRRRPMIATYCAGQLMVR